MTIQIERQVCPKPATTTENHCVNCVYDGLKKHRELCLHPDSNDRNFWTPTLDNKCRNFVCVETA